LQGKAAGAGSAGAGVTDGAEEPVRQFGDSIWLAATDDERGSNVQQK
jgi:hypothetical protein